jgi:putative flavoprotein involved in K+ transport
VLDVANVIWCTGYSHAYPWIDLPIFDSEGRPIHERGVVSDAPGMYFVGLHFLYAMSSATLIGVDRDADYAVKALDRRTKSSTPEVPERLARAS